MSYLGSRRYSRGGFPDPPAPRTIVPSGSAGADAPGSQIETMSLSSRIERAQQAGTSRQEPTATAVVTMPVGAPAQFAAREEMLRDARAQLQVEVVGASHALSWLPALDERASVSLQATPWSFSPWLVLQAEQLGLFEPAVQRQAS